MKTKASGRDKDGAGALGSSSVQAELGSQGLSGCSGLQLPRKWVSTPVTWEERSPEAAALAWGLNSGGPGRVGGHAGWLSAPVRVEVDAVLTGPQQQRLPGVSAWDFVSPPATM